MNNRENPGQARAVRLARTPEYSVLLVARDVAQAHVSLARLLSRPALAGIEIVVAIRANAEEQKELQESYPAIRFVAAPMDTSGPELRMRAMRHVGGDVVFVTQETGVTAAWAADLEQRVR